MSSVKQDKEIMNFPNKPKAGGEERKHRPVSDPTSVRH